MKTLIALLAATVAILVSGCATNGNDQVVTPARVESLTRLAAYGGARAMMLKEPASRVALEQARNGFCALKDSQRWDLAQLATIAASCGLDELNSETGTLALTGGVLLLDLVLGKPVDLSTEPYARAVVIGSCEGLTLALGPTSRANGHDPTMARLKAEERATRNRP